MTIVVIACWVILWLGSAYLVTMWLRAISHGQWTGQFNKILATLTGSLGIMGMMISMSHLLDHLNLL